MVQERVQLEHSSHIVRVGVEATCYMLTLQAMMYIEGNDRAYLELCHRNPEILERVLNEIVLSNSTPGNCRSMQVVKQPEHGKASTSKEQN